MQKSLPADRCTQSNEKDPSIRNKKVPLSRIHHPALQLLFRVFKAIYRGHAPKSIKELIEHRNSNYDLTGNDISKLPKANTTTNVYGLKSWSFMAPKLWNVIPESHRTIRSFKVFKKILFEN